MGSRPLRPIGLPIYVARRPAAPFIISSRCGRRGPTDKEFRLFTSAELLETRVFAQRVPERI
jgi:hypothetical protein